MKRTKPLILIDSDYAGLYVPKNHEDYESFVGELGQDSTMIAPKAIPDREFVKAFICNLALYATYEYVPDDQKNSIGKIYRKARNSYYWQSNRPSGLALMSYELYGLPYLKVSVPHATTDEKTWDYCVQYWQYNMRGTVSSGYSFMEEQVFQTGEINITPIQVNKTTIENITITENFTLLTTENTQLNFKEDQLVLPERDIQREYPLKTIVKNITLLSLEDPIEVNVSDLPLWEGEFVDRLVNNGSCWRHNQSAGISYSHTFTENSEIVIINIRPVEVVDCEQGLFRIYQTIRYGITYEVFSPVLLDVVDYPDGAAVNENITVTIRIENIVNDSVSGKVYIENADGTRLAERNVSVNNSNVTYYNISFRTPQTEGLHSFFAGYEENNETKTNDRFVIKVKSLKSLLQVPLSIYETQSLSTRILLENNYPSQLNTKLKLYTVRKDTLERTMLETEDISLPEGTTKVITYKNPYQFTPGEYYTVAKIYSEIRPEGEVLSQPLTIKALPPVCGNQGTLTLNDTENITAAYETYCDLENIVVLINLTNSDAVDHTIEAEYVNTLIMSLRNQEVRDKYWQTILNTRNGSKISFIETLPANSTEEVTIELEINHYPTILSVTDSQDPQVSGEDIQFSVKWNDSDDDDIKLYICKTDGLNGSHGCINGTWCSTSDRSYEKPVTCNYTTSPSDEGMNEYHAFVCDRYGACSTSVNGTFEVYVVEECPSGGISTCEGTFCCGVNDGICPEDFDNVSCSIDDVDCY